MSIPRISHAQALVLYILTENENSAGESIPGRFVRRDMEKTGIKMSGPSFYQMMARMEDRGLIAGHYEKKTADGQTVRERAYKSTKTGVDQFNHSIDFYLELHS